MVALATSYSSSSSIEPGYTKPRTENYRPGIGYIIKRNGSLFSVVFHAKRTCAVKPLLDFSSISQPILMIPGLSQLDSISTIMIYDTICLLYIIHSSILLITCFIHKNIEQ